jgi:hypothetical protein
VIFLAGRASELLRGHLTWMLLCIIGGLAGCDNDAATSLTVGADAGPLELGVNISESGDVSLSSGLVPIRFGLGPISFKVGLQQSVRITPREAYSLLVVWRDSSGNLQRDEYAIGREFKLNFNRSEWVREVQGHNNSVVLVVDRDQPTAESGELSQNGADAVQSQIADKSESPDPQVSEADSGSQTAGSNSTWEALKDAQAEGQNGGGRQAYGESVENPAPQYRDDGYPPQPDTTTRPNEAPYPIPPPRGFYSPGQSYYPGAPTRNFHPRARMPWSRSRPTWRRH